MIRAGVIRSNNIFLVVILRIIIFDVDLYKFRSWFFRLDEDLFFVIANDRYGLLFLVDYGRIVFLLHCLMSNILVFKVMKLT